MKHAIGLLLGFTIGAACRLAGIPAPAPEALLGALLVLALTLGYLGADRVIAWRAAERRRGASPDTEQRGYRG